MEINTFPIELTNADLYENKILKMRNFDVCIWNWNFVVGNFHLIIHKFLIISLLLSDIEVLLTFSKENLNC